MGHIANLTPNAKIGPVKPKNIIIYYLTLNKDVNS